MGGTLLAQLTDTFTGQVIEGGTLSVTEIVRLQVAELPQSSVATQVRVTLNSCGHKPPGKVLSVKVTVGLASHKSIAVAAGNVGTAGHSTVVITVGHVIIGAVLSVTEMVRLQVAALPQLSVAVQVRVTLNSCGHKPPGIVMSAKVTVGLPSHTSEDVALAAGKVGVAGHSITGMTAGQVIIGGVWSLTVMV